MPVKNTQVRAGHSSDVGRTRDHNEDAWFCADPSLDEPARHLRGRLWVVADGMGGHAAGEVASRIAIETIAREYQASRDGDVQAGLQQALQQANAEIYRQAHTQGQAGMGTTVVCAVVRGAELYLAHVGDSRAYLLRDGTLHLLTQDHTLVNEQVRHGLLTPEEASDHPQRHILSRALGARPEVAVEIGSPIPLRSGDTVMLCSDGVSGYVDDPQIAYALHANRDDPQTAADTLIQLADAAGGHDNATAIVLWIEKVVPLPRSVEAALATVLAPGPAGEIEPLPEAAARGGRARGCRRPGTGLALLLGGLAGLAAGVALTLLALSLLPGLQAKLAPPGPAVMPEESSVPAAAVATETPSPTATPSPSATPSATVTLSPTATRTASPSATVTASPEGTPESPPHRPVGRAF